MARTMLMDSKLTDVFWTHAVHTVVHIQKEECSKTSQKLLKTSRSTRKWLKMRWIQESNA